MLDMKLIEFCLDPKTRKWATFPIGLISNVIVRSKAGRCLQLWIVAKKHEFDTKVASQYSLLLHATNCQFQVIVIRLMRIRKTPVRCHWPIGHWQFGMSSALISAGQLFKRGSLTRAGGVGNIFVVLEKDALARAQGSRSWVVFNWWIAVDPGFRRVPLLCALM